MRASLRASVRRRARSRCEYCLMPARFDLLPFQVDHVISVQHRGRTRVSNLAFACSHCNAHKGPNIASLDPMTGMLVPLYNPRSDAWRMHFRFDEARLVGLTPVGRATVEVLAINEMAFLAARAQLMAEGVYPNVPR